MPLGCIENHKPKHIANKIREALDDRDRIEQWKINLEHASKELKWDNEKLSLLKVIQPYA